MKLPNIEMFVMSGCDCSYVLRVYGCICKSVMGLCTYCTNKRRKDTQTGSFQKL